MVEHIVHIDGVTGSSPVATTWEPNRKVRLVSYMEKKTPEDRPLCVAEGGHRESSSCAFEFFSHSAFASLTGRPGVLWLPHSMVYVMR